MLMNVASHKWQSGAQRKKIRRARLDSLLLPLNTLTVDCGGGGIKSAILDRQGAVISKSIRTPVAYPFTPDDLLAIIEQQIRQHQLPFKRITVGMPGIIRRGVVTHTPHYIRQGGPHTDIDQSLEAAWNGLQLARNLSAHFSVPCKVLNDAEVAAYAVIRGVGNELVLTLGTGLGCAFL
ncbi:ROK family protein [Arcanobacterium hippocoleae]|uniref:ROK family protein n=1 Tax=Arcanobacterium hippocoleae TaxID=149017 RepID=UPI0033409F79